MTWGKVYSLYAFTLQKSAVLSLVQNNLQGPRKVKTENKVLDIRNTDHNLILTTVRNVTIIVKIALLSDTILHH